MNVLRKKCKEVGCPNLHWYGKEDNQVAEYDNDGFLIRRSWKKPKRVESEYCKKHMIEKL